MLAATLCMNTTTDCAMTDLIAMARAAETRLGVQAVTVFGGFPISDLAETGLSIVTVADTPASAAAGMDAVVACVGNDDDLRGRRL